MPTLATPNLQRRWKSLPGGAVGDAGDVYTGYDRFGRVERMRWGKLGEGDTFAPLVDVSWGYSPASQKTWRNDLLAPASTGQDQHFGYDGLYQVTQRQRGLLNIDLTAAGGIPAQQEDFSYDETGNWTTYQQRNDATLDIDQTRVNNPSNQVTQVDGSSAGISYDGNGNMLRVPMGEALTDPSNRIVWDGWNRPVKVYDAEDTLIAEYRYDGLGRRITVTTGSTIRHTYYDDQWRSIEERIDDTATAERQHVWHPNDRWEMLLRDRSITNNGVMDERLYPMKDQLDPVALSDDTGTVVERYDYSAFGLPTFLNPDFTSKESNVSSFLWEFLFHAEFQDADTGWFNYGYRYYSPQLGRWLSRDPIGEEGGMNLYAACYNNVINWYDYLGRDPKPVNGGASTDWYSHHPSELEEFADIANKAAGGEGKGKKTHTGEELLDYFKELSEDNCCIKTLTIAGHGWASGGGPGIPGKGDGTGFYESGSSRATDPSARNLLDLQNNIYEGDIKFCEKCEIKIHACRISPSFAEALGGITGCKVTFARGACSRGKGGAWHSGVGDEPGDNNDNNGFWQTNGGKPAIPIKNNYRP